VSDGSYPGRTREVSAPFADGESLAGAVGDLGDVDRAVPEKEPIAIVAAGRTVVIVNDEGVQTGRVTSPDRADVVRRGDVTDRGAGCRAGRGRIDDGKPVHTPGVCGA